MNALLGAIARPGNTKPNDEEAREALEQLAKAAAAICRAMKNDQGVADRFVAIFNRELERRFGTPADEEE